MSEIRLFDGLETCAAAGEEISHLAIGMFDGVHLGHGNVIASAIAASESTGGKIGALTFWPHPSRLFQPQSPTRMILGPELKKRELQRQGLNFIIEEPFTAKFAGIEASAFVSYLKRYLPNLRSVHCGENWRFGRKRLGDIEMLKALAEEEGISAVGVATRLENGDRVSSTRIRSHLTEGELEEANALLGYDYYTIGTVTQGRRMGRKIGFPTLNLPFEGDLIPALGVYAVSVSEISSRKRYSAVANFGVHPTMGNADRPLLEAHLLEECPFDYGHRLLVRWKSFIRSERKFASIDALREQIALDAQKARSDFGIQ